ncbi:MAG: adenosylhomocysteinase [Candidatus Aenigmarchaeota archaeon]|nr:adenosylhomocysteinase [Candidatus Aenigmarchaeota archaeon]
MPKIKDLSLAEAGRLKVEFAEQHMPALMRVRQDFEKAKPLKGIMIAACLHVTKETAVLAKTLAAGSAEVALCGSNPLSTQDDVAAYLAKEGIDVFAWHGVTTEEYYWCINQALATGPNILIDDGADLISTAIKENKLEGIICGLEETTTGVIRFKAMERDKALKLPIIAVNNAKTKMLLDNIIGTGQSTLDGILRATNILLAGKTFVVAGYGNCGKGLAKRAEGMGCKVVITETDPIKALQAFYDGYSVMGMDEAAKTGDIFVTVTGNRDVIKGRHIEKMKSGAIIANSGHFNVEINTEELSSLSAGKRTLRPNLEEYRLKTGKIIYLLAEGRLVNLAAAEGHPSEIMQTSFCNQALCVKHAAQNRGRLEKKVYDVPHEIDRHVAELALASYGVKTDILTQEQKKYLESWEHGT